MTASGRKLYLAVISKLQKIIIISNRDVIPLPPKRVIAWLFHPGDIPRKNHAITSLGGRGNIRLISSCFTSCFILLVLGCHIFMLFQLGSLR